MTLWNCICLQIKFVPCVRPKPDLLRWVALIWVYCLLLLWTQEEPVQQTEQVIYSGWFSNYLYQLCTCKTAVCSQKVITGRTWPGCSWETWLWARGQKEITSLSFRAQHRFWPSSRWLAAKDLRSRSPSAAVAGRSSLNWEAWSGSPLSFICRWFLTHKGLLVPNSPSPL